MGLVGSQAAWATLAHASVNSAAPSQPVRCTIPFVIPRPPFGPAGSEKTAGPGAPGASAPADGAVTRDERPPVLLLAEGGLRGVEPLERHDRRNLPLLPHLVDLGLEVPEVLLGEVREPSLLEQVLAHGLAGPAVDDRLGLAVVLHDPVLDLVEREDAGLDGQL